MPDAHILAAIDYHSNYIHNDVGGTSHLTKLIYFKNEAKRRGIIK